ncbi:MAG: selenoneine biosynthesis selenosugar synthase SenB [Acidimicrobiales bacterium]
MRICLVTPRRPGSAHGNGVTAERWVAILGGLGHAVELADDYRGQPAEALVALHARRSAGSLRRFRDDHPAAPVVLALTGTDLYPGLTDADRPVLEMADRLVVLQPLGLLQLPDDLRHRASVIFQSATAAIAASGSSARPPGTAPAGTGSFDVVLLANLRRIKDPLLAARAARRLPPGSPVRVRHAGVVLDQRLGRLAEGEGAANPRYEWLGELSRTEALRTLAASRLLLLTSRNEGGANAVSEALAAGVPIVATKIPGTVGILGEDYPGYVPVGDARALADLLVRVEADRDLYGELVSRCAALRPLVSPDRERAAWQRLLGGLGPRRPASAVDANAERAGGPGSPGDHPTAA